MISVDNLKTRWLQLCFRSKAKEDLELQENIFNKIVYYYAAPNRFYHNNSHLIHLFSEFDKCRTEFSNLDNDLICQYAIFFHDIVYGTNDNEKQSSNLFLEIAAELKLEKELTVKISNWILATKHLDWTWAKTVWPDEKLFLDIDLSILGQDWKTFEKYDKNICREYSWVPIKTFCQVRRNILQQFLDKEYIFRSKYFRNKYEIVARENLNKILKQYDQFNRDN